MARLPRFVVPGQPQHVIVRGNNRSDIFYLNVDYQFYLEKLGEACEKHGCLLHAYVLMTNHVHLLLTPLHENSIAKALQMLGRYYVQHFNFRYQRSGTLWEGRYRASLIDSQEWFLTCMCYIELNPVRAGMVAHPSVYAWSSYARNALGGSNALITPHEEYQRLASDDEARQVAYRALFQHPISALTLDEIRDATNKAWVLGSDTFKRRMQEQSGRRVGPLPRGGDRKSALCKKVIV